MEGNDASTSAGMAIVVMSLGRRNYANVIKTGNSNGIARESIFWKRKSIPQG